MGIWLGVAHAAPPGSSSGPGDSPLLSTPNARVIVLPWTAEAGDTGDEVLQRMVRGTLARPEARFYPAADLYQAGRMEGDPSIPPGAQRGAVPDEVIARVEQATEEVAAIPWNGLIADEWSARAHALVELAGEVWFVDRKEMREPLFRLYAQIGRAAEGSNDTAPPFYEQVGELTLNAYSTLAGIMAFEEPELLSTIADWDLRESVAYHADLVRSGNVPTLALSFDDGSGTFDPDAFAAEYRVFVNGLERRVTDPDGVLEVPLGRADVELERTDGRGLSARADLSRRPDRVWPLLATARQRILEELRDALVEDAAASVPRLEDELLAYLAIYARLHPASEIYVAVPDPDASASRPVLVWRWDRTHALLARVGRDPTSFPVRFAATVRGGVAFGTVRFRPEDDAELAAYVDALTGGGPADADAAVRPEPGAAFDGVPLGLEVRAHVRHVLVGAGFAYAVGAVAHGEPWADVYPADGHLVVPADGDPGTGAQPPAIALRERSVSRLFYALAGVGLGHEAARGLGPVGAVHVGWTNVPHALELTAHAGATVPVDRWPRFADSPGGRVQFIVDPTLWGGVLLPLQSSLYVNPGERGRFLSVGTPFPTFGMSIGAGWTF